MIDAKRVRRLAKLAGKVACWRGCHVEVVVSAKACTVWCEEKSSGREFTVLDTFGDLDALERALKAMGRHGTRGEEPA